MNMDPNLPLILASKSPSRANLLKNAGIVHLVDSAEIDERRFDSLFDPKRPEILAQRLATEKAAAVSPNYPDHIILGADQVMIQGNTVLHKPGTIENTRTQLLALRGLSHTLISGFALVRNAKVIASGYQTATLTFRIFSEAELETVLILDGENMKQCAGGYQLEGPSVQLFDQVDGDYFTILGLPLLPVLAALREAQSAI